MLTVEKDTAVALLTELGSKAAGSLTNERLAKRLQKLPDSLDDESGENVETPEAVKLLKKIQKDPSILDEVEVVDAEANGHAKPANGKKKVVKEAAEEPEDEDNGEEDAGDDEEGDEEDEGEEDAAEDVAEDEEPAPAKAKGKGKGASNGKAKGKGAKKGSKPRQGMSCIDAAAKVLTEVKKPLNCKEMIEKMEAKKYWSTPGGATPHATLASAILREIQKQGKDARFRKTSPGHFAAPGVKAK